MLRSHLVLAAAVLAMCAPLARSDDPKPPAPPATALERVEALQKDLNKKITDLQADVAALKAQANRLDSTSNVLIDSWEMRNQIDTLTAEVARLRDQLAVAGGRSSTSNLGPTKEGYNRMPEGRRDSNKIDGPRESRRPALGTFRMINALSRAEVVRINGLYDYTLAPGETVDVVLPPGQFTYHVLGTEAFARTSTAVAGKTVTATVAPR